MNIQGSAVFSDDGELRLRLDRWWSDLPRLLACMANPSRAGGDKNDPTVHSLMKLAQVIPGCGGMTVVNREPKIATDPAELTRWVSIMYRDAPDRLRAIRAENLLLIRQLSADCFIRVVAWGELAPVERHTTAVLDALSLGGTQDLYCFGTTKAGNPKHPLARGKSRIPAGTRPTLWRQRLVEAA